MTRIGPVALAIATCGCVVESGSEAAAVQTLLAEALSAGVDQDLVAARESVVEWERIGPYGLDLTEAQVARMSAGPTDVSPDVFSFLTASYLRDWSFDEEGVVLGMEAESPTDLGSVFSIRISESSPLRTSRGIGIGSTADEVWATYGDLWDEETCPYADCMAAGSYSSGHVYFIFDDDAVSEIGLQYFVD